MQPKDTVYDTAGAALKPSPLTAIAQWELAQKEAIYASTQCVPLHSTGAPPLVPPLVFCFVSAP